MRGSYGRPRRGDAQRAIGWVRRRGVPAPSIGARPLAQRSNDGIGLGEARAEQDASQRVAAPGEQPLTINHHIELPLSTGWYLLDLRAELLFDLGGEPRRPVGRPRSCIAVVDRDVHSALPSLTRERATMQVANTTMMAPPTRTIDAISAKGIGVASHSSAWPSPAMANVHPAKRW